MKIKTSTCAVALAAGLIAPVHAAGITLETAPPVIVRTQPVAGATNVDPRTSEIVVMFSKPMQDGSWSWSTWGDENFPEMTGQPHYDSDGKTCVLPVKLEPGKFYATWLNSEKFKNFKDRDGRPAVPYLLTFTTAGQSSGDGNRTNRGFEHQIQAGETLSSIVKIYRDKGDEVSVEEVLKANPGLDPKRLQVGRQIDIPAIKTESAADNTNVAGERKFVRIVLDGERMTFEGQPANWDNLDSLVAAVTEREDTVLEWAVPSMQITIQQQNDWMNRFAALAQKYGFEYSSYVGVHPFGLRGEVRPGEENSSASPVSDVDLDSLLNDDQKAVVAWTDRQFHSFFDERTFDGWSDDEIKSLEAKSIDALDGPRSREYYTAINTLGALRSTNALPRLRDIAFERVDKNNRDRWMAVRVLGIMADRHSIPELIHLVYHGNQNTHWWAQITMVRLTGQNFGGDWEAWGKWWNESGGQPPYNPEIIRWWDGQAEPDKLAEGIAESDRKFLKDIRPK